jgi:hypothetical protein
LKKALPFILLGGAALLFCFGIAALAFNFLIPRTVTVDTSQWIAPQDQVDNKQIKPEVALGVLAGVSDSGSVDDSLAAGDFEGAFAQIAYGTDFSDADRVGTAPQPAANAFSIWSCTCRSRPRPFSVKPAAKPCSANSLNPTPRSKMRPFLWKVSAPPWFRCCNRSTPIRIAT